VAVVDDSFCFKKRPRLVRADDDARHKPKKTAPKNMGWTGLVDLLKKLV
jgi:hypothetical protein